MRDARGTRRCGGVTTTDGVRRQRQQHVRPSAAVMAGVGVRDGGCEGRVSEVSESNIAFIEPARDFLRARRQAAEACMHQAARKQAGAQGRATRGREVKAWGGASGSGGRSWGERGGVGTQQSSPNALICGEEWWEGSNIEKWGGARRSS